jgi:cytochrome P450
VASFADNTFLSRLLRLKGKLSEKQLKDHIFTVTGAGFETTGTASAHCILLLALNPAIQAKAFAEIVKIFPSDDDDITLESLSKLDYLDRVMKESLRLAPTVHALAREATENFEISPGRQIPKGSIFVINIYGLHRRTELWGDDALVFNPDRFLLENFSGKEHFFIPFSSGKRNCIGYRYALVSFKI